MRYCIITVKCDIWYAVCCCNLQLNDHVTKECTWIKCVCGTKENDVLFEVSIMACNMRISTTLTMATVAYIHFENFLILMTGYSIVFFSLFIENQ